MSQYVLKRVGLALLTLVLLSLIIFFAGQVLPGNAGRAILGPFASQQSVVALDHKLGVDRPLVVQYWSWVSGFVRGNLGTSYQFQSPVSSFLFPALGRSLKLAAFAFVIVVPTSIPVSYTHLFSARTVATTTAASGLRPEVRHLMSKKRSAPISAPNPCLLYTSRRR